MRQRYRVFIAFFLILVMLPNSLTANANALDDVSQYHAYRNSFEAIHYVNDISENGFRVIDSQTFDMEHGQLGILTLIPAIHREYSRLALFFALPDDSIAIKTDDFMANSWLEGQLKQTNREVICISCVNDLDGDGLEDIIVITSCQNDYGDDADQAYNVGDVLFQNQTGFYRDPRISDKINRFDMNKGAEYIHAFILGGASMEFLFVAKDMDALLEGGLKPINYLRTTEHLEKFGVVDVVPGIYSMTGQYYLMIYIVDQGGNILWNFQPMHHYENFYDILEISFKDIDGDGNKDLTLLARYADRDAQGNSFLKTDYDIYYQRAGYFLEDSEFKSSYTCREDDDIDVITNKARQYWGWPE